jgi:hypothetical protein
METDRMVTHVLSKLFRKLFIWGFLAVLALVADTGLWLLPALVDEYRDKVEARCAQVRAGMTREEVLDEMDRGGSLTSESEVISYEPLRKHELRFTARDGVCVVTLDSQSGRVNKVNSN